MKNILLVLIIGISLPMTASADRVNKRVINRSEILFRVNSNYQIKCIPGLINNNPGDFITSRPTRLVISIDPLAIGWGKFQWNVFKATYTTPDLGDHCARFSHLFDQPNPNWKTARAERVVTEYFNLWANGNCSQELKSILKITLVELGLEFTNQSFYKIGFVDDFNCVEH